MGLAPAVDQREDIAVVTGSSSAAPAMQPRQRVLLGLCPGLPTDHQLRHEGLPEGRQVCEVLMCTSLHFPGQKVVGLPGTMPLEEQGPRHSFLVSCMRQFIENHSTDESKHLNHRCQRNPGSGRCEEEERDMRDAVLDQ